MSLLNDALKRAKLEALEREADGASDYGLPTPRDRRRKSATSNVVLTTGVLLLAALGMLLGWWLARAGSGTDSRPAQAVMEQARALPGALATPDRAPGVESTQPPPSTAGRDDPPPNRGGAAAASADESPPVDEEPRRPPAGEGEAPGQTTDSENLRVNETAGPRTGANDSGPAGRLVDGASFVRVLDLDGVRLELQGIAFQGGRSVAIINDLMVAPEDMVAGFRVVAIEPERVQLQGRGVTLQLTLH